MTPRGRRGGPGNDRPVAGPPRRGRGTPLRAADERSSRRSPYVRADPPAPAAREGSRTDCAADRPRPGESASARSRRDCHRGSFRSRRGARRRRRLCPPRRLGSPSHGTSCHAPPLPPLLPARPVPPRAASPSSRRSTWPTRKRAWSRLRRPHRARPPPLPASRTSSVPSSRATPSSRVRHPARVPHRAWALRRRRRRPRNHPTRHRPHLTRHPPPAIGRLSRRPDRRPPQGPPVPVTSAISRLPRTRAPVDSPPSPGT
ncbi:hypothetical protein SAURM35S_04195 [Streptomyces aurantiogriseus]